MNMELQVTTARRTVPEYRLITFLAGMKRGIFILFEGMDRSGKSSQCTKLVNALSQEQMPTSLMRFPDRETTIGKLISSYLKEATHIDDHAIHLLFAANRWEKRNEILATLESGKNIVMDRYSYSGVAFSAAKGLDAHWCRQPEIGLPKPDVVFFLDISPEVAKSRGGYGEERYETDEMQRNVREKFKEMFEDSWVKFDADQSMESLHAELLQASKQAVSEHQLSPIQTQ